VGELTGDGLLWLPELLGVVTKVLGASSEFWLEDTMADWGRGLATGPVGLCWRLGGAKVKVKNE